MRQAIEDGFILDDLRNYTPYSLAFKLTNDGEETRRVKLAHHQILRAACQ